MDQKLTTADPLAVIAAARLWFGTPYLHQASTQGAGADCLGLARGVWRALHGAEPFVIPPYTRDWGEAGGRETLAFAELLLVPRETGLGALDMACQLAQEQGHLNTSVVLNELRRLTSPPRANLMETPDALVLLLEPVANCARYDELRGINHV